MLDNLIKPKFDINKITGLNDIMFRGVMFDNIDILRLVMENCMENKVDDIILLNNEMSKKRFLEMKKTLDVYAEESDMLFDIEVSTEYTNWIINRNLAFGFKIYTESVNRGGNYSDYKTTCVLNIIGGKVPSKSHKSYLKNEENKITSKKFIYKEIYVDYYIKRYYNKGNEKLTNKYKYIIMLGLNLRELEEFSRKYGDEIVERYKKSFKEMLLAKPFEPLFTKEEDEKRIKESIRKEGIDEGMKQGRSDEKMELAKNFKKNGVDIKVISKATGLSIKQIMML